MWYLNALVNVTCMYCVYVFIYVGYTYDKYVLICMGLYMHICVCICAYRGQMLTSGIYFHHFSLHGLRQGFLLKIAG